MNDFLDPYQQGQEPGPSGPPSPKPPPPQEPSPAPQGPQAPTILANPPSWKDAQAIRRPLAWAIPQERFEYKDPLQDPKSYENNLFGNGPLGFAWKAVLDPASQAFTSTIKYGMKPLHLFGFGDVDLRKWLMGGYASDVGLLTPSEELNLSDREKKDLREKRMAQRQQYADSIMRAREGALSEGAVPHIMHGTAEVVGAVGGTLLPILPGGWTFNLGGKLGAKIGDIVLPQLAKRGMPNFARVLGSETIGEAAKMGSGMAAYTFASDDTDPETGRKLTLGERAANAIKEGGIMAGVGATLIPLARGVGGWIRDDKAVTEAISEWAQANRIAQRPGELAKDYAARALTEWSKAGHPGVAMPTTRKFLGWATESGLEGLSWSLVNSEFQHKVTDLWNGYLNPHASEAQREKARTQFWPAIEDLLSNMLGMGLIHAARADWVLPWQREQPGIKPYVQPLLTYSGGEAPPGNRMGFGDWAGSFENYGAGGGGGAPRDVYWRDLTPEQRKLGYTDTRGQEAEASLSAMGMRVITVPSPDGGAVHFVLNPGNYGAGWAHSMPDGTYRWHTRTGPRDQVARDGPEAMQALADYFKSARAKAIPFETGAIVTPPPEVKLLGEGPPPEEQMPPEPTQELEAQRQKRQAELKALPKEPPGTRKLIGDESMRRVQPLVRLGWDVSDDLSTVRMPQTGDEVNLVTGEATPRLAKILNNLGLNIQTAEAAPLHEGRGEEGKRAHEVLVEHGLATEPSTPDEIARALTGLTLINHLRAKYSLPGMELTADGTRLLPSKTPGKVPSRELVLRFGQTYARDFGSFEPWKPITVESRAKMDAPMSDTQRAVARDLADWRQFIPHETTPMVSDAMDELAELIGRIPAAEDIGVRDVVDALSTGSVGQMLVSHGTTPEAVNRVLLELAHMAVDKAPGVVAEDLANWVAEQAQQQQMAGEGGVPAEGGPYPGAAEPAEGEQPQPQPTGETYTVFDAGGTPAGFGFKTRAEAEKLAAELGEGARVEAVSETKMRRQMRSMGSFGMGGEAGEVFVPDVGKIVDWISAIAKEAPSQLKRMGRKIGHALDLFMEQIVNIPGRLGAPEITKLGRSAIRSTKQNLAAASDLLTGLLKDVSANPRRKAEKAMLNTLRGESWDGDSGWTNYHTLFDDAAGAKFDKHRDQESPLLQNWLERAHKLFLMSGKWMEQAGARAGKFFVDPNRWRFTRHMTQIAFDAIRLADSKIRVKLMDELVRLHTEDRDAGIKLLRDNPEFQKMATSRYKGLEAQEAINEWQKAGFNGLEDADFERMVRGSTEKILEIQDNPLVSSLVSLDPAETIRSFTYFPDRIRVGDQTVEILESHPFRHLSHMVRHAAMRAGFRSSFYTGGGDVGSETSELIKLIGGVPPMAKQATINLIKTLNGLPLYGRLSELGFADPDSWFYPISRGLGALMSIWRGAKLSVAFAPNIPEPIGAATDFLGAGSVKKGYDTFAKAFASALAGNREPLTALSKQLSDAGVTTRDVFNWEVRSSSFMDRFEDIARIISRGLSSGNHWTQEANEMVVGLAAIDRVAEMRAGRGGAHDAELLRQLGYEPGEIQQMLSGKAAPALYDEYQKRVVAHLMAGSTALPAERTRMEHARAWRYLFSFTNYAFRRMGQLKNQLGVASAALADAAADPRNPAAWNTAGKRWIAVARSAGYLVAGGLLANAIREFFRNGAGGVAQLVRDTVNDPAEQLKLAVANNIAAGPSRLLFEGLQGTERAFAEAAWNAVTPLAAAREFFEMFDDRSKKYAGTPWYDRLVTYLTTVVPAAKMASDGVFGMTALAIGRGVDHGLAMALRTYHDFRRETGKFASGGGDERPEVEEEAQKQFFEHMTRVGVLMGKGAGKDDQEVQEHLRAAFDLKGGNYKAYAAIRQSIAPKLTVTSADMKKFTPEEIATLHARLGDEGWQRLQQYDALLKNLTR